jgi:hypothetical protein
MLSSPRASAWRAAAYPACDDTGASGDILAGIIAELVPEHATAGRAGQSADQSGVPAGIGVGSGRSVVSVTVIAIFARRIGRSGAAGERENGEALVKSTPWTFTSDVFGAGVSVGVAADLMLDRNNRASGDVPVRKGMLTATQRVVYRSDRVARTALRPTAVGARLQVRLQDRFQHQASLWSASPGPQFETAGGTAHCVRDTRNAAQVEPLSSVETVAEFPPSAASA